MQDLNYDPIHVAIGTVIIILVCLVLGIHPFKSKTAIVGSAFWTADAYFNHIKKLIILADSLDNLRSLSAWIEGFRVKTFREKVFRRDRNRYYKMLKEQYEAKERNLILHPKSQHLCKS